MPDIFFKKLCYLGLIQFWLCVYCRYTEYVSIKHNEGWDYEPEFDNHVDHEELYDLTIDPQENFNKYDDPEYKVVKEMLSARLREKFMTN